MRVGFIGLGNVGGKLANNLLVNGVDLCVCDLDLSVVRVFTDKGAGSSSSPREIAELCDLVITCLPNPASSAAVVEGCDGIVSGLSSGKVWAEMSTTDSDEVCRLAELVHGVGAMAVDCPVSGGCHRAATGNISIFCGGSRIAFEKILPILSILGRDILHTGDLGSASILKVVTNYLATANLVSVCEALTVSKMSGMDLRTAYEAIRISSGNSFVHETEGQVILNGSRDINFTMDLVMKDISLFQSVADRSGVKLELSPLLVEIFADGIARFGERAWSPNIIKRLEETAGVSILADGFPAEIVDDESHAVGSEIKANKLS